MGRCRDTLSFVLMTVSARRPGSPGSTHCVPTSTLSLRYAPPPSLLVGSHHSVLSMSIRPFVLVYVSLLTHIISASPLFVYINVSFLYCKLLWGKTQCFIQQTFIQHLQWYGYMVPLQWVRRLTLDPGCQWHGFLNVWPWASDLTLWYPPSLICKMESRAVFTPEGYRQGEMISCTLST